MGKSRLLQSAAALARSAGAGLLKASAYESELIRPFGVWNDALKRALPDNATSRLLAGGDQIRRDQVFDSLVGVLDTDAMLFGSDFRSGERAAQLLTQVAGRAGRAGLPGRVILQTHHPDHPALQAMLQQDYREQAAGLLAERQAAGLPPAGQILLLRSDCGDPEAGEQFLRQLRQQAEPQLPPGCTLIGPLPSPMQRRAGKFRSQLLLTAADRSSARTAAATLVNLAQQLPARGGLNWSIDIDPQDMA